MPFLPDGASTDSTTFAHIGYALPAAHLIVDRDKLLAVKRGFEDEYTRVREWLRHNRRRLMVIPSPGKDPASESATEALGLNGEEAVAAADGYVRRLDEVAAALGEIAKAYGLMEDKNTTNFTPGPR